MMINGKFSSITDFIQSIEDIVNSDLGKVFLIPFIYGAAGLCIYLIKKKDWKRIELPNITNWQIFTKS